MDRGGVIGGRMKKRARVDRPPWASGDAPCNCGREDVANPAAHPPTCPVWPRGPAPTAVDPRAKEFGDAVCEMTKDELAAFVEAQNKEGDEACS